ncbi:short-chain dehydrogenase [Chryseobacterium sp. T16E-39]|uniref:SDR family oxidoreductase n=1 Tax=Chryseobacterium sp. T16E-39 TaxID=2015076 RepID=UPI000B5B1A3D|nr:SDR family oxidoreductase [Chryseobacterium sp. T16E-39]ASK29834.1 short-chain dehydrogenase [Chryseobacterium sp. T16E-39]
MIPTANSLEGKKVIVMGGSAGIGLATAKAAAKKGAILTIVASNQQRIDSALGQLPENATGQSVDLSKEENIRNFFTNQSSFDHLVYTAGENLQLTDISETSISEAQKFFTIRYWGALAAVKYGASKINAGGSIVLTSGIAGNRPGKGWGIGASITSAMEGFTRAMAVELAPTRVNIVSPGIVKTDLWGDIPEKAREEMYQQYSDTLLVKKIASPEDIALAYIYLMEQSFSTGNTIVADGGGLLI